MKILLLNDTSASSNWGCQATSAGLDFAVQQKWSDATVESIKLPKLRFRKLPFIRKRKENYLKSLTGEKLEKGIEKYLNWSGIPFSQQEKNCDIMILNGEGSIHSKSGHSVRLLSIIYRAYINGIKTMAVNQSIAFSPDDKTLPDFLCNIYNKLDCVQVREPFSLRTLEKKTPNVELVPDAAFLVDLLPKKESFKFKNLPSEYVVFLGSSALKKNDSEIIKSYIEEVRKHVKNIPIVFLSSTKTDFKIATDCKEKITDFHLITQDDATFHDACNIIEKALFIVGGRFHPAIFAAIRGTPFIPLHANTHKIDGLVEMLNYPIEKEFWKDNNNLFSEKVLDILNNREKYSILLKNRSKELTSLCKERIFKINESNAYHKS